MRLTNGYLEDLTLIVKIKKRVVDKTPIPSDSTLDFSAIVKLRPSTRACTT